MAAQKLVNLLALLSVALVACSFGAQPANALAAHGGNAHLNRAEHHALAAKKQRRADASKSRRCRKRPSSTASLAHPTSSAVYSSTQAASSATSDAVTSSTEAASSSEAKSSSQSKSSSKATTSSEVISSSSQAQKTSSTEVKSSTSQTHTSTPAPKPSPSPSSTHSSSSAVSTVTPPSGGPGGPGKVGLAWPNGNDPSLKDYITSQTKWLYTWSPEIPSMVKGMNINAIPMLWGADQEADFVKNAAANCIGGYLASFNEPNQGGQSNLSPQDAATIHMRSVQPFAAQGYKIIAPVTSSDPRGFTWVQDFFAACHGCEFSAIALHYYDISPQGFIDYIEKWHNEWPQYDVFITEFACQNFNNGPQCSSDQTWDFWATAIKYMEAQPWIKAYFGFGAMHEMQGVNPDNQLMASGGNPTSLGYTYINANWQ